ncbi:MAG: PilZ domain-containing protein [Sphingomonadales bacterium]|nr:MAG: PilZ domain-containing protein [Sphingomonadales bacterium]
MAHDQAECRAPAQLLPAVESEALDLLGECLKIALGPEGAIEHASIPVPGSKPIPVAGSERRTDQRHTITVYRSAILRWRDHEGLCLIRDISPGGMMCHCPVALTRGERVEVELRSGHRIAGSVAWCDGDRIGLSFDERIDVAGTLNAPSRGRETFVQRMPRLRSGCPVTLVTTHGTQAVALIDISQGGAKVEAPLLRKDDLVTLGIGGLEPHRGMVRWTREGRAGIAFLSPVPFDALARWAAERATPQRVGTGSAPE